MKTFIILIAIILLIWIVWSLFMDQNLESPRYIVLEKSSGYEVRQYDSYIIAETTVSGNSSASVGRAFGELGGYIFGGNIEDQSIAMTAPVTTTEPESTVIAMTAPVATETKEDMMTMSFMMPAKYNLGNLPKPNSRNVTFREVPSGVFATYSFTGWATNSRRIKKTNDLKKLLERDGVTTMGEPQLLQYDRPTKFPLLRTNEIKIEIKDYE